MVMMTASLLLPLLLLLLAHGTVTTSAFLLPAAAPSTRPGPGPGLSYLQAAGGAGAGNHGLEPESRREHLMRVVGGSGVLLAGIASPAQRAAAAADTATHSYVDSDYGFTIDVPKDWVEGTPAGGLSSRRKIVVWSSPDVQSGANAFVAYTPVRADYTSFGAMGGLDEISTLVLPANREGVKSTMLEAKKEGSNNYVFDYVVKVDGQPVRHSKTIWTLIPSQTLITVAAQANEDSMGEVGPALEAILASYVRSQQR